MGLSLAAALRIVARNQPQNTDEGTPGLAIAFVGAGGKSTAIFHLARELETPSLITTTTHLGRWQAQQADFHLVAQDSGGLGELGRQKVTLVTGPAVADERLSAVSDSVLRRLRVESIRHRWPLLIEADGARQRPLKAPGPHEPQVPDFAEIVIVVAGMAALGHPLDASTVHRPETFSRLTALPLGTAITSTSIARELSDRQGGLKGIPARSRRIALLNQAETPDLQAEARKIANAIQGSFDATVIAALHEGLVHAAYERCAGVVLAAGAATRFGRPKQLLLWHGKPLVRSAVDAAMKAGLDPIFVVTGANAAEVETALAELPLTIVRNAHWQEGQSSSVRRGLDACPPDVGAAVFLLADQPLVPPSLIQALLEVHATEAASIVAPLVQGGRRANPVLFDREVFADLRTLQGDVGGRAVLRNHQVKYVPWHDDRIALDIDTEADFRRLQEMDRPW